jgi:hypothetical protein
MTSFRSLKQKPHPVNEMNEEPVPYDVSYSQRVREELKKLIIRARARGEGPEVIAAVKEMDRRLRIYPQFGQPLRDLHLRPLILWIGVVEPLVVRYVVNEDKRQVLVGVPVTLVKKAE